MCSLFINSNAKIVVLTRERGRILFNGKEFKNLNYDETIEANKILHQIDDNLSMSTLVEMVQKKAAILGQKVTLIFDRV